MPLPSGRAWCSAEVGWSSGETSRVDRRRSPRTVHRLPHAPCLGKPRAFGFGLVQEHEQTGDSRGECQRQRGQQAGDGRVPAAPAPGMAQRGNAVGLDRASFEA